MTGVVGVDPGGRTTGVVAIDEDDKVTFAELVERDGEWHDYRSEVIGALIDAARGHIRCGCDEMVVAIEDVVDPNPHMGLTNIRGLLDTARILEAVCMHVGPSVVVVPPGGHGSGPLAAYPPELVGPREKAGTGKRRHVRSAYDVALAGRVVRTANAMEATE